MLRAVTPEVPPAIKPEARMVAVIPAGTRTGLNTRNSGMEAANAMAVLTRDRPASNKRNTAAVVAKNAVKTPLNVGFGDRTLLRFFLPNNIFSGQIILLVLSDGYVVGFHELGQGIFMNRERCDLRVRHVLTPCVTMQVSVELYVTSMPIFYFYLCFSTFVGLPHFFGLYSFFLLAFL